MEITIESPHIGVPQKLKKEAEEKLSHLIGTYERMVACEIILKKEKTGDQKDFCIEAKLLVPKGSLFAATKAESFETALDKLLENIKRQLHRHKEKLEEVE